MSGLQMKSVVFRREREAGWVELEELLARIESTGLAGASAADLERLPLLYRAVISSFSVASAISLDAALRRYLGALAQRAYIWVYGVRRPLRHAVARFFTTDFPCTVRAQRNAVFMAAGLMALGTVIAFIMVTSDPSYYFSFVPQELQAGRTPYASTAELHDTLFGHGPDVGGMGFFSSYLFVHNTEVALLVFGLGIVGGLPTAFLMLMTGLMLGAFAAMYTAHGLGWAIWGWLLVHGVTELSAVIVAGAAGLTIGRAVLAPGRRRRGDALRDAGRQAGLLGLGAACMLVLAAFMEAFARQQLDATPLRWAWALATLALWLVYFLRAGRRPA